MYYINILDYITVDIPGFYDQELLCKYYVFDQNVNNIPKIFTQLLLDDNKLTEPAILVLFIFSCILLYLIFYSFIRHYFILVQNIKEKSILFYIISFFFIFFIFFSFFIIFNLLYLDIL
jgi:4-amino-4-deoxy-L-arabinose transferase-like glycosyltransferase